MQEIYNRAEPLVKKAARSAENRWNRMLDADDIEQELWLFVMESPSVQNYIRTQSDGEIVNALNIQADNVCAKERVDYDHFTGNFIYSPMDVRDIIAKICEGEEVAWDENVDLEIAMEEMRDYYPDAYVNLDRYFFQEEYAETGAEKMRKSRALEKATELMNRKRSQREADRTQGPGTRPAITKEDY